MSSGPVHISYGPTLCGIVPVDSQRECICGGKWYACPFIGLKSSEYNKAAQSYMMTQKPTAGFARPVLTVVPKE